MTIDAQVSESTSVLLPQARGGTAEIRQYLRRLDRKDSWYWWNAILIITLLMGTIVVLSLPTLLDSPDDPSFQLQLTSAVRGLLGLVLIFNVYTLYQQHILRKLRSNLAGQIEIATEQKVRAEAFYEMAILDPLTGLYNRRYSDDRLKGEILRTQRSSAPLIVILFDLDYFKMINDRFGHAAGDDVLKEFGHRLSKATRGSDFAVRIGGDEFMVVLPECPSEKVQLDPSPFHTPLAGAFYLR